MGYRLLHSQTIFRWLFLLVIFLQLSFRIQAAEEVKAVFDVHGTHGTVLGGRLRSIGPDWTSVVEGRKRETISGKDLLCINQRGERFPPLPREQHVLLTNGDRIPGTVLALKNEKLHVRTSLSPTGLLVYPIDHVAGIWLAAPQSADDTDHLLRKLGSLGRRQDLLILRNADRITGTLISMDEKAAKVETGRGRTVSVETEKLGALSLNSELARPMRLPPVYGRLLLDDGGRITLSSAGIEGARISGQAITGHTVQAKLDQIVRIWLHHDRIVLLSELPVKKYEHRPYFGVRWPYEIDAAVGGTQLRLGGNTYDKGIGMHSESSLSYDLGARFEWCQFLVGLDDLSGREGHIGLAVKLDGKGQDLKAAATLSHRDGPRLVRLPVHGVRELTLSVLFGERGDVQDHVNLVEPVLIR